MYNCKEFFGKSVLSLYEGELVGVVDKLYFDKKLKKLMELELIGEDGARLNLNSKNIYHIGKNAITIKNNMAVNLKVENSPLTPCAVGSKAYTIKGEFLGIINEISLTDKFLTEKFLLDNGKTIDVNLLASSGKNTTIFYENNDKVNVKKFLPAKSPKIFKTNRQVTAQILPTEPEQDQKQEVLETPPTAVPVDKPMQSPDFLIGRVCTKDIFNFNNEILVKAHSVITKKTLKEVNRFNKLRELMLYSK